MQGGLGEQKRDILKLREEVNGLTVKSASHEVDLSKTGDARALREANHDITPIHIYIYRHTHTYI